MFFMSKTTFICILISPFQIKCNHFYQKGRQSGKFKCMKNNFTLLFLSFQTNALFFKIIFKKATDMFEKSFIEMLQSFLWTQVNPYDMQFFEKSKSKKDMKKETNNIMFTHTPVLLTIFCNINKSNKSTCVIYQPL